LLAELLEDSANCEDLLAEADSPFVQREPVYGCTGYYRNLLRTAVAFIFLGSSAFISMSAHLSLLIL
jgi:hypothetical protein